jgi:hypothetical protein
VGFAVCRLDHRGGVLIMVVVSELPPVPAGSSVGQAVVLCMDEKSQVQALDGTQPSLPMKKGRAGTMTHDYKRHGTTTLFAALNVLTGTVIGRCLPRHRNTEFLKFLRVIDREVPPGLQIHMICDNYGTHKHANVAEWLAKHPRFHLHFTPLLLVAQSGRTVVSGSDRKGPAPGRFSQRKRAHHGDRGLPESHQRQPEAVRLDRYCRTGPRQSRPGTSRTSASDKSIMRHCTSGTGHTLM